MMNNTDSDYIYRELIKYRDDFVKMKWILSIHNLPQNDNMNKLQIWFISRKDHGKPSGYSPWGQPIDAVVICSKERMSYFKWLIFNNKLTDSSKYPVPYIHQGFKKGSSCPDELVSAVVLGMVNNDQYESIISVSNFPDKP